MAIPESISSKSQLRKAMRQMIRESRPNSESACAALEKWLAAHPGLRTIAAYAPLPGEVDLFPVLTVYPRVRWVFPKVRCEHLTFHPGGNLVPGAFGIDEPTDDSPEVPIGEIDAFICPGLAFDPAGHRLGRGRGFYDRLLAQARVDSLKIGICFPFQLVINTFPEPHDVRMDTVLF